MLIGNRLFEIYSLRNWLIRRFVSMSSSEECSDLKKMSTGGSEGGSVLIVTSTGFCGTEEGSVLILISMESVLISTFTGESDMGSSSTGKVQY
ncbi:hypothetical protein AVEN_101342-1 [Araneus ventricosus]|uniref:Uncharacterized protein n=1 Tax=Araneus ventricosus TaxID=182803 RepID=A0A4Y2T7E4_ARAVE|nr:hypothetical protein AVEN_101342-1 [Araneus ventricosus]